MCYELHSTYISLSLSAIVVLMSVVTLADNSRGSEAFSGVSACDSACVSGCLHNNIKTAETKARFPLPEFTDRVHGPS